MPLDPQAQRFLDALAEQQAPGWDEMSPAQGRDVFAGLTDLFGPPPEVHRVRNETVAGRIPLRIYTPESNGPLPVVMYFHGGGWVLGDLDTHDTLCRHLANDSGCIVVSVDYRRSPENKFPAAVEDCWDATCHVAEHAQSFGADATRIAVAGDSVGGNLAAVVALKARDEGGPSLHSQWLLYPAIQPQFDTASYSQFAEGYGLTQRAMRWFWRLYLTSGSKEGGSLEEAQVFDDAGPEAAPIRADALRSLPPAHVITAEFDALRDEGEMYADRLREAGVPVTTRRYEGMIHGFVHFAGAFDEGRRALNDLGAKMREVIRG